MIRFHSENQQSARWLYLLCSFFCALFLAQEIYAQEKQELSPKAFAEGILVEVSAADLSSENNFLIIKAGEAQKLALASIALDGKNLLSRTSREAPPQEKLVHWFFDTDANCLVVNIGALRASFLDNSVLKISFKPVNTRQKTFTFSVFQANGQQEALSNDSREFIKDINVDLKTG